MHLATFAASDPDRAAVLIEPAGTALTYRELDERSNQVAHLLRERGLGIGRRIAIMSENRLEYLAVVWGAQRAGLYHVGINIHLTASEAGYILGDSEADLLVASDTLGGLPDEVVAAGGTAPPVLLMLGTARAGWEDFDAAVADQPRSPIADEAEGDWMLYSSGTTGRPKGIRRPLDGGPPGTHTDVPGNWLRTVLDFRPGDVYLVPAPLYHAAPLGWSLGAHRSGGTVVVMERFDAGAALELIERHRVTHSQWVPTMFVRMLKLPTGTRSRYDFSSHRRAIHAAAPCPPDVKRAMIDWWGPILFEYYSCTEGIGATSITSEEWLHKPGSVGRPLWGTPYITDDDGRLLPTGDVGNIWFSGGQEFEYHNDPDKTDVAHDGRGGSSVGDLGHLDEDGYLFLSDRRSHLIISGGVNIYPKEIEDALVMHPSITDVGVVGVPDAEMGERVVAGIQLSDTATGSPELTEALTAFARSRLAGFKVPRDIRYLRELPRTPAGKLRKHELLARLVEADGPS